MKKKRAWQHGSPSPRAVNFVYIFIFNFYINNYMTFCAQCTNNIFKYDSVVGINLKGILSIQFYPLH